MHSRALAQASAEAQAKILREVARLGGVIDFPRAQDPQVQALKERQAVADFLEKLPAEGHAGELIATVERLNADIAGLNERIAELERSGAEAVAATEDFLRVLVAAAVSGGHIEVDELADLTDEDWGRIAEVLATEGGTGEDEGTGEDGGGDEGAPSEGSTGDGDAITSSTADVTVNTTSTTPVETTTTEATRRRRKAEGE